jgi:hypothetical protein
MSKVIITRRSRALKQLLVLGTVELAPSSAGAQVVRALAPDPSGPRPEMW